MKPLFTYMFSECNTDYSSSTQDTGSYSEQWANVSQNVNQSSPWIYQNKDQLPIWGLLNTYGSGGYFLTIPDQLTPAKKTFTDAYQHKWLDRYTRFLVTELTLHNPDANIFVYSNYLMELSSAGIIQTSHDTNVMTLYNYSGNFALFRVISEILFVIFLAYNLMMTVTNLRKNGRTALTGFWPKLDLVVLFSSFLTVGLYVTRMVMTKSLMSQLSKHNGMILVLNDNLCHKINALIEIHVGPTS